MLGRARLLGDRIGGSGGCLGFLGGNGLCGCTSQGVCGELFTEGGGYGPERTVVAV